MTDPRLMADLRTAQRHAEERRDTDCTCAACDRAYSIEDVWDTMEDTVDGWTREVER